MLDGYGSMDKEIDRMHHILSNNVPDAKIIRLNNNIVHSSIGKDIVCSNKYNNE